MSNITNKLKFTVFLITVALGTGFAGAEELSPGEIIKRVDENHYLSSAKVQSVMIIEDRGRTIKKEMTSYVQTTENKSRGLSEFTNPRDRGTKYLKIGDDMWMYFPDAEDLIKISGHMLRQGMMGSDFSYEDILESEKLTDLYNFELEGTEKINQQVAYRLLSTAKEDRQPSYQKRRIWVDRGRFIVLKEHLFSASGRLLKELNTEKVKEFNGRWIPVIQVMNDKLRRETRTTFRIKEIEPDYDIPEGLISLEALQ